MKTQHPQPAIQPPSHPALPQLRSKDALLKHQLPSAQRAVREARAGAAADWAEAGAAAEVGRLARWDDLHTLFTVEAVGDAWGRWRR